ncbi:putative protein FAM47D [Acomys russatus]|uniref:putative protein FAM47D n=1 Tax=Acomys russatus TaxID=60746 RepID=UPI0021E2BFFB|nr:putative protein FAM47D [Acomys russatus]XP_050996994.1 putative protein FAM47D [Acomys russatus]
MGDQGLPENQPHRVSRCKHVLKHKKEQQICPPFMEGHHRMFSLKELDGFTRHYEPGEEILSQTILGPLFPRISHEVPSTATKKSHSKLPKDSGLLCSVSVDRQGSTRTQYKLDGLSPMEGDAEDHFIHLTQIAKYDQNLNKGPNLENRMEANKNSKYGKHLHRQLNLGTPEKARSSLKDFFPTHTSRNQNLLGSLSSGYTQRGGDDSYEWNGALGNMDVLEQFDMDYAYQSTYKDSSEKKISHLPSKLKYFRGLSKEKDIKFSEQDSKFKMKLQKPHDLSMATKEKFKYGTSDQKPMHRKAQTSKEPLGEPKSLLEIQGKSFCKPDVLENLYGTIAFKDFIVSKGYDMPGILKKFFVKKGWDYNSVNTPLPSVLKDHEITMQNIDDEDDQNGGKELD